MQGLKASSFFDENGLMGQTERLSLEIPAREDLPGYIDAVGCTMPGLANWYRRDAEARRCYWETISAETSLYCSIRLKRSRKLCGFCTVEKLTVAPFEIRINLLSDCQGMGIGAEAVSAFVARFEAVVGPSDFVARIEPKNVRSQKVFRKLGFVPDGIDTFIIKDPLLLERFEEKRLDEIDDDIRRLAEEFNVEPRKLLSHLLVFSRRAAAAC